MAHIPDGVLALPVLISGAAATFAIAAVGVRKLQNDRIPQAAVLAAAFFVSSLVNVPVGPSSVHLILNGLMGLILGWTAVPAILVALLMQSVFFGHGGLITLGVNTFNIAVPALLCAFVFRPLLAKVEGKQVLMLGMLSGFVGASLTGVLVGASLVLSGAEYLTSGKVILMTYIPLVLAEAAITGVTLVFLKRVSPEILFVRASKP